MYPAPIDFQCRGICQYAVTDRPYDSPCSLFEEQAQTFRLQAALIVSTEIDVLTYLELYMDPIMKCIF